MSRELRRTYLATSRGVLPANDVRRARSGEEGMGCAIELTPDDEGLGVMAVFRLERRSGAQLVTSFELLDPTSEVLASASYEVTPDAELFAVAMKLRADIRVIRDHEIWGALYSMPDTIHLRWRVKVFDASGRRLGRNVVAQEICGD